jgi:hypothetical protein
MDFRFGCHEPRLDGRGSDDLGDIGIARRVAPGAVEAAAVTPRRAGEVDRVRGSESKLDAGGIDTDGLVNPLLAFLGILPD